MLKVFKILYIILHLNCHSISCFNLDQIGGERGNCDRDTETSLTDSVFDWCFFWYLVRNRLVALLEALRDQFWDGRNDNPHNKLYHWLL